ncbi:unnamed protein product [Heterobilharzia americana]|nr:unnamed protein product [Heterobilharzia americana]
MQRTDEVFQIRRTDLTDVKEIEKLKNEVDFKGFGKLNLVKLIERSTLSLCITDNEHNLAGNVCFYEYPNSNEFPQDDWISVFTTTYCIKNLTPTNSLFLHLLLIDPNRETFLLNQLLKSVFLIASSVHHIFVLLEVDHNLKCINYPPFHKLSKKRRVASDAYCVYRHDIFPVLFSRSAAVEDTDDLTPMINASSDILRKTYGDYYVSELIEAQSDEMRCIVVEFDRRAVGFVSATRDVNLKKLNEHYDLDVFNGLVTDNEFTEISSIASGNKTQLNINGNIQAKFESSYISTKEQVNSLELDQSKYYYPLNNEENSQSNYWTKRLLQEDQNISDVNRIELTDSTKSNAFAIQIFIMKPEYESRFMDMLPLLFHQFPDLDYAVISVPRLVACFPMLKSFVHCRVRRNKDPDHELYVFHRSELHRDFIIRRTRHSDVEAIKVLVSNMNKLDRSLLLADLHAFISSGRDEDGTIILCYVAVVLDKVVGVAILRGENHIEWLRAHYNIDDFIYYTHYARNEHVSLYHFLLAANFHSRTSMFLREILRQSKKACIYYRVLPPYASESAFSKSTLATCLSVLCPVRPRKQIIYPKSLLDDNKAPEKRVLEKFDSMPALFMTTSKLLMEPREVINARIIVVGASTAGLAVLETLATCPYIRFNNLVLLSPHGLPGDNLERIDPLAYKFLPTDHAYSVDYLSQLGLKVCVNVVYGKLTAIDRKFKRITISSNDKLSYDYLIITTGLQYHASCPVNNTEDISKERADNFTILVNQQSHPIDGGDIDRMRRRFTIMHSNKSQPGNLFLINDVNDVLLLIKWINTVYLPLYHEEQVKNPKNRRFSDNEELDTSEEDDKQAEQHKDSEGKEVNSECDYTIEEIRVKRQHQQQQQRQRHKYIENEEEIRSQSNNSLFNTFNVDDNTDTHHVDNLMMTNLIIVYGYTMDAYTCITGLLNAGVSGKCIIMIQPPRMKNYPSAFDSLLTEQKVHEHMQNLKIRFGYDFVLDYWNNGDAVSMSCNIETVTFSLSGKQLTIPCLGLFCFHMRTVDMDIFNALNDSCLVFDSRLVIDTNFHTNDPSIRAAGPITKFERIYYDDFWRHEIAHSQEVGQHLGTQLLDLFDPNIEKLKKPPQDDLLILPTYEKPKVIGASLPGNLNYLHYSKPCLWEPLEIRMRSPDFGRLLVTGEDSKEHRYFSIHINKYNLIQGLTCLSAKEFPAENYIRLYNVHEYLLKHLVSRFDEGLISDFYAYLDDIWTLAVYHDRFSEFKSEIRRLTSACSLTISESLATKVESIIAEKDEVPVNDFQELKLLYDNKYKKEVEQRFIKFITHNYNLLPMYAKPDLV